MYVRTTLFHLIVIAFDIGGGGGGEYMRRRKGRLAFHNLYLKLIASFVQFVV